MCGDDGTIAEQVYKIGDRYIVLEFYGHNEECGKAHVQINELLEKDIECFSEIEKSKIKKMPVWMGEGKSIVISLDDLDSTIRTELESTFEDMWCDDLTEKEDYSIPDKLKEKIEKKFTKRFLKNIKGLDI